MTMYLMRIFLPELHPDDDEELLFLLLLLPHPDDPDDPTIQKQKVNV